MRKESENDIYYFRNIQLSRIFLKEDKLQHAERLLKELDKYSFELNPSIKAAA